MSEIDKAISWSNVQATNAVGLNSERGLEIMRYCDMAIKALKRWKDEADYLSGANKKTSRRLRRGNDGRKEILC